MHQITADELCVLQGSGPARFVRFPPSGGKRDLLVISYTITYRQADGSWTDTQDISGIAADKSVIAEARKLYSAGETAGKNTDENVMSAIEEGVSQEKGEE